jgi:hypothetical protein
MRPRKKKKSTPQGSRPLSDMLNRAFDAVVADGHPITPNTPTVGIMIIGLLPDGADGIVTLLGGFTVLGDKEFARRALQVVLEDCAAFGVTEEEVHALMDDRMAHG